MTKDEFIELAEARWGGANYYATVEWVDEDTPVKVVCKTHGPFLVVPKAHLADAGCPVCKVNPKRSAKAQHTLESWRAAAKASKNFCGFKVYLIRLQHPKSGEDFFKVGVTFRSITERMRPLKDLGYNIDQICVVEGDAGDVWAAERLALRYARRYPFKPSTRFDGASECFGDTDISPILNVLRLVS